MNIIIEIFVIITLYIIVLFTGKKWGYSKREQEFQKKPIDFVTSNGYPIMNIFRSKEDNNIVNITIYDTKFTKINY